MKVKNYNETNDATETIQYDFVKPEYFHKPSKSKSFLLIIVLLIIVLGVLLIIFKKQGYNFLVKGKKNLEIFPKINKVDLKDSKNLTNVKLNQVKENLKVKLNTEKKIQNIIDGKKAIIDKNKKEKLIKVGSNDVKEKNSQIPLKIKQ